MAEWHDNNNQHTVQLAPSTLATINQLIASEKLPQHYYSYVTHQFCQLAQHVYDLSQTIGKSLVIGINGSQGSGKSTLALFLETLLTSEFNLAVANLSIDDFYLKRDERKALAENTHPLLLTRGVPGTHDIALLQKTINQLRDPNYLAPVAIPRFDKALDDRCPDADWDKVTGSVDIVILEGWCVGALPASSQALAIPINQLEAEADQDGSWRRYVNKTLATSYRQLFDSIDYLVMLQVPSFDHVFNFRLLQEKKLAAKSDSSKSNRIMSDIELRRFIQHYQRITEDCLATLPEYADAFFALNNNHEITDYRIGCASQSPCLIVTDLDGTLLDHHNYSFSAAQTALTYLTERQTPVVINTSKTAAELAILSCKLNNNEPFIVENGSAIYIPKDRYSEVLDNNPTSSDEDYSYQKDHVVKCLGKNRAYILQTIHEARETYNFKFEGFADWHTEKLMSLTGLDATSANLALDRHFSEPILWHDSEIAYLEFLKQLKAAGLTTLKGGRFIHILGITDKGIALSWLKSFYRSLSKDHNNTVQNDSDEPIIIGFGDSPNDIAMLAMTDIAVVVRSPQHSPEKIYHQLSNRQRKLITHGLGPIGWQEAIQQLFGLVRNNDFIEDNVTEKNVTDTKVTGNK